MIEHLPQELRDRFTDMREMDLGIHSNIFNLNKGGVFLMILFLDNMDELEKRVKVFFNDCKRYQNLDIPQTLEEEYKAIRKEYYKTLEDADEKVRTYYMLKH